MTDINTAKTLPFEPEQDAELDALDEGEDEVAAPAESEAPAKEPEPEPEAPAEPEPKAEPVEAKRERGYQADATTLSAAHAKLTEIDAALDALADKYEAGELSFKDYRRAERDLSAQQNALRTEAVKAEVYADMQRQQSLREWNSAVEAFRADPANQAFESPAIIPLMNSQLNALWQEPGIAEKSHRWVLDEAKRRVQTQLRAVLGVAEAKPEAKPVTPRPSAAAVTIPPTLGRTPAALPNGAGGEFAALDSLNGIALEDALARMKPEQRDRWLDS